MDSSTTTEPEGGAAPPASKPPWKALAIGGGIALFVAAIGVTSLLLGPRSSNTTASSGAVVPGQLAPQFILPSLMDPGQTVAVPADGGGHGKPAVLVFFASWCGPCQKEMPALAAAVSRGEAGNAAVLGIDGQDQPAAARAFVTRTGVTFPVGVDQTFAVVNGKYGFGYLPETVFINGSGIVTSVHYGATTPALLRQGVKAFSKG